MLHTKDIKSHKRHAKEKEGISKYSLNYVIHFESVSGALSFIESENQ